MIHRHAAIHTTAGLLTWALACAIIIAPAVAQEDATAPAAPDAPDASAVPVRADIEALLKDNQVFPDRFSLEVWNLTPPRGRRIVLIPVRVLEVARPMPLDRGHANLAGAQFVAWYIPKPQGAAAGARPEPMKVNRQEVYRDPPRLARGLIVHPGGEVEWQVARSFAGGEAEEATQMYTYVITPTKLRPPQQDIPRRNPRQDAAQYNRLRNEAMERWREQMTQYRALADAVKALPTEIRQPASTVYAVYYDALTPQTVTLTGADPLPWALEYAKFTAYREAAKGVSHDELQKLVEPLLADDQPVSRHVAAALISGSDNLTKIPVDSPLAEPIAAMMTEDNEVVRQMLINAIEANRGRVPLGDRLLRKVVTRESPETRLAALRAAAAETRPTDRDLDLVASITTTMLASEEGPGVAEIIAPAFELVERQPDAIDTLSISVDLTRTHPSRRPALLATIIHRAQQHDPLATRWLGARVLGIGDSAFNRMALEMITDGVPGNLIPATPAADGDDPAPPGSADTEPKRLLIDTPRHGLIALLAGQDPTVTRQAWAALDRFMIGEPPSRSGGDPNVRGLEDVYTALVDAAIRIRPTPMAFMNFLDDQDDSRAREQAMQQLLREGTGPARTIALMAVLNESSSKLTRLASDMSGVELHGVASLWYEAMAPVERSGDDATPPRPSPMVLALLRQKDIDPKTGATLVKWFLDRVDSGERPEARAWIDPAGGTEKLLDGMFHDDQLYALGCAAALVAQTLPPDELIADRLQRKAREIAEAVDDPERRRDQLTRYWSELRKMAVQATMQAAAGEYRVVLRILPMQAEQDRRRRPRDEPESTAPPAMLPQKYDLGTITLAVDDAGRAKIEPAKLAMTVTETPLGLSLNAPGQLAQLPDAAKVDLSGVTWPEVPLVLTLNADGEFEGGLALDAYRVMRVILTRVE